MTTIADVFADGPAAREGLAAAIEQHAHIDHGLLRAVPDVATRVADEILQQLGGIPVWDFVANAWCTQREVLKALDQTKRDLRATTTVALTHHRVRVQDRIRVEVDGIEQPSLEPVLTLTLTLDGIVLTIAHGKVVKIGSGRADAFAELRLGDVPLATGALNGIKLPGTLDIAAVEQTEVVSPVSV